MRYKYSPKPVQDRLGPGHIRYDHGLIPSRLEVVCPKCNRLCHAVVENHAADDALTAYRGCFGWSLTCAECVYRATSVHYDEIPALFWQLDAGTARLWAWNRDHLVFLLKVLDMRPYDDHPYRELDTYLRREWLRPGTRRALVKAIKRELRTSPI